MAIVYLVLAAVALVLLTTSAQGRGAPASPVARPDSGAGNTAGEAHPGFSGPDKVDHAT